MIDKIFVFGASISASPWMTWVDFLAAESALTPVDLSSKGVGNEYMLHALVSVLDQVDTSTLVVIMLTNVDKWDWYVTGDRLQSLKTEKHPPKQLSDNAGFWCTGSWFPGRKRFFGDEYYDDDYFTSKTIQTIVTLQSIVEKKKCKLEIFFDSPIWDFTEQDINAITQGQQKRSRRLLDRDLSRPWATLLPDSCRDIASTSLIGHCWSEQLPWYNLKYKGHPPSSSHWSFYQNIMRARISEHLTLADRSRTLAPMIQEMDLIWQNS